SPPARTPTRPETSRSAGGRRATPARRWAGPSRISKNAGSWGNLSHSVCHEVRQLAHALDVGRFPERPLLPRPGNGFPLLLVLQIILDQFRALLGGAVNGHLLPGIKHFREVDFPVG